jgi:hypothetical protein
MNVFGDMYNYIHEEYLFRKRDGMSADERHAFEVLYLNNSSPLWSFTRKYGHVESIPREAMTGALESLAHAESILHDRPMPAVAAA